MLRLLRNGPPVARLPHVLPGLPVLWRAADSGHWEPVDTRQRSVTPPQSGFGGLGSPWAQRSADQGAGVECGPRAAGNCATTTCSTWPGAEFGVRPPDPEETPLSWDEVHHGRKAGLL